MLKNKQDCRTRLELEFRKLSRGEELLLGEVAGILQVDCGEPGRHSDSLGYPIARRAAVATESETNGHLVIRWDRERNAWRALLSSEIPDQTERNFSQIRKKSKHTARMAQAAIVDGIQGHDRDRCVVAMTTANLIYDMSSRRLLKKTVKMCNETGGMSQDEVLKIFRDRK